MNDFKYFDLMHRYARGKMTAAERSGFEKQLAENPELAGEWTEYQVIAGGMQQHLDARKKIETARDELRQEGFFEELYGEIDREKAGDSARENNPAGGKIVRMWSPGRILAVAASALVLIVAGYFMLRQPATPQIDLAAEIRRGFDYQTGVQGYSPGDTLSLMQQLLRDGKSEDALALAAAYSDPGSNEMQLEIGRAHLQLQHLQVALNTFQPILKDSNALWPTYCEARWLTALAYLELNKKADALREFEGIIADQTAKGTPSPFREDALRMRSQLK